MRIVLRPAQPKDFDYCGRLYFAGMEAIIKELNLNLDAQIAGLRQRWDVTQGSDHCFKWYRHRLGAELYERRRSLPGAAVRGRPVSEERHRF
jgi:hypothetical protein